MSRRSSPEPVVEPVWDDRVIVAKEFAKLLRVGPRTLYRWVREGRVPPPLQLSSRTLRWRLSTVRAFLTSREVESSGPAKRGA